MNLVLSLHEHIIDVCKQQQRDGDNIMWNFHHFYNSILIYCISFIDGEIILEYVPPQQHILILKVLFQIKNSCPVWLDFVLNLPNGNITSYCQIFSSDNLIEMIEFDWIERTIYANDQYKHSGTVESEYSSHCWYVYQWLQTMIEKFKKSTRHDHQTWTALLVIKLNFKFVPKQSAKK